MYNKLLSATSKGLVVFTNENEGWNITGVHFTGLPVSMAYVDERENTWWVGISHRHWGEKLHYSNDEGKTWKEAGVPSYKNYYYRPEKPATLKKLWVMQHAGVDRPGCLWLGTEPGGLFFSNDHGKSWQLIECLWNHPSRLDDHQWFGAGKDHPFIHSIVIDPGNSAILYVGVSCAGVFKTTDGGKTWQTKNKGLVATYLPNPNAEVGHDPHRLLLCASHPNVIWQQNHCGIFRTIDGGENWNDVSGKNGFPFYGFALAIDDHNPETAWVIPAQSDEARIPHNLTLCVCQTSDGGNNWITLKNGLPSFYSFDLVLRHAFTHHDNILAFGTNNGNLFCSMDKGKSWHLLTQHLATIYSLLLC